MLIVSVFTNGQRQQVHQLAKSVSRWQPDAVFWAVLMDQPASGFEFNVLQVSDLNIPNFDQLAANCQTDQLWGVVKTQAIKYFLLRADSVVFLENHLQLSNSITPFTDSLNYYDLVLLPQINGLFEAKGRTQEQSVLKMGVFRTDCLAVKQTPNTLKFINWWADRTLRHGQYDYSNGFGGDQLWLVHALSLVDNLLVFKETTNYFLTVGSQVTPKSAYGKPAPTQFFGISKGDITKGLKKAIRFIETYNPPFLARTPKAVRPD